MVKSMKNQLLFSREDLKYLRQSLLTCARLEPS